jgi:hypothetical protein
MKYLYLKVSIVLTCGKHLYDVIISQRGEVYNHTTSLTPPLFIEVPVPNQINGMSCIYVRGVSNFPFSTVFVAGFKNYSDSVIFLAFI